MATVKSRRVFLRRHRPKLLPQARPIYLASIRFSERIGRGGENMRSATAMRAVSAFGTLRCVAAGRIRAPATNAFQSQKDSLVSLALGEQNFPTLITVEGPSQGRICVN